MRTIGLIPAAKLTLPSPIWARERVPKITDTAMARESLLPRDVVGHELEELPRQPIELLGLAKPRHRFASAERRPI